MPVGRSAFVVLALLCVAAPRSGAALPGGGAKASAFARPAGARLAAVHLLPPASALQPDAVPGLAPALLPHVNERLAAHRKGLYPESPALVIAAPNAALVITLKPAQPWEKIALPLPEGRSTVHGVHAFALSSAEGVLARRFVSAAPETVSELRAYWLARQASPDDAATGEKLGRLFDGVVGRLRD